MTIEASRGSSRRLVVVGPSVRALARLRGRFIGACVVRGVDVMALAPDSSSTGSESLLRLGVQAGAIPQGPEGFTLYRARKAFQPPLGAKSAFHLSRTSPWLSPIPPASERRHYAGLLAIELDPDQSDPAGVPPAPLSVAAATALAGHLAKDLDAILDGITPFGMIVPGALYDQTEILLPGLPLIGALAELYQGSTRDAAFAPRLIALGTDRGFFPVAAINPLRRPGSGPLLLLPFCFVGQANDIAQLARIMEDRLLQNGQVSPATTHHS